MLWSSPFLLLLLAMCASALQVSIPSPIYISEPATYTISPSVNSNFTQTEGFVGMVMYEANTIGRAPQVAFSCPKFLLGNKFEDAVLIPVKEVVAGKAVKFTAGITGVHVICVFGNLTQFDKNFAIRNERAPLLLSTPVFNVYEPVYIGTIISVTIGAAAVLFIGVCFWQDYKKRASVTYEYEYIGGKV